MGVLAWLGHVANGLAPGLFLALMLPLLGRALGARKRWGLVRQMALQGLLTVAVLLSCLVWLGQDGRILSYALLVLVTGSAQAWLTRP